MNVRFVLMVGTFLAVAGAAGWMGGRTAGMLDNRQRDAQTDWEMRIGLQRVLFRGDPALDPKAGQLADETAPWLIPSRAALMPLAIGGTAMEPAVRPTFTGLLERLESSENPVLAAFGSFDLELVLLVFLPWLLLFTPMPGSKERWVLLGAGAIGSVLSAAVAGLDWRLGETWIRLGLWVGVTVLYSMVWLRLREALERLAPDAWRAKVTAYVGLVLVAPALTTALANVIAPVSRASWAASRYEASRPVALEQSKALAAYYERYPEFANSSVQGGYDAARAAYGTKWRAAWAPADERLESSVSRYRWLESGLRLASPTALCQGALREIAGTGRTKAAAFAEGSEKFAREVWAPFFQKAVAEGGVKPDLLNRLPKFEPAAPGLASWLPVAGAFTVGLAMWLVAGAIVRKR